MATGGDGAIEATGWSPLSIDPSDERFHSHLHTSSTARSSSSLSQTHVSCFSCIIIFGCMSFDTRARRCRVMDSWLSRFLDSSKGWAIRSGDFPASSSADSTLLTTQTIGTDAVPSQLPHRTSASSSRMTLQQLRAQAGRTRFRIPRVVPGANLLLHVQHGLAITLGCCAPSPSFAAQMLAHARLEHVCLFTSVRAYISFSCAIASNTSR